MATTLRAEKDMITIPREEYEEMQATFEILQNPRHARRILDALDEVKRGKLVSEREFVKRFKL